MPSETLAAQPKNTRPPGIFSLLRPYRRQLVLLGFLAIVANILTLLIPKLLAHGIDTYVAGNFNPTPLIVDFGGLALGIFVFTCLQSLVQTFAAEKVALDIRLALVDKISRQGYRFIEERNPATLLTNLTSDIDSIKLFVSQVVVSLVTSTVIIIGAAIILLTIDWELALAVLTIIPLIGGTFYVIFGKVRPFFKQSREVIDWLNKVIRENIIGASLIRVLNSNQSEYRKFNDANLKARTLGISIVRLFAFMIPIVTFVATMGTLTVVTLGGYFVIEGAMTLGSFAAFMSYIVLLIFPILVLGMVSSIIAQAGASYARIRKVLEAPDEKDEGTVSAQLQGHIRVNNLGLNYNGKTVLKAVSLEILPGTRTAIIGPTAAGKTQLLNVLAGLAAPQSGSVEYDGRPLAEYERASFYPQVGLVFQDSVLFNTTLRENIAFSAHETSAAVQLAIDTAELAAFIATLPLGLDTLVSERGTSLSGGQKQRIMLARALALKPRILFLDDFTARVDTRTEQQILANITRNYPDLTLVSITQKIMPVRNYDQVILLMEGEILARGTHDTLMQVSPEYIQIYESQRSTSNYELRT